MHWNLPHRPSNVRTQHHHSANGYLVSDNICNSRILCIRQWMEPRTWWYSLWGCLGPSRHRFRQWCRRSLGEFVELYVLFIVVYVFYVLLNFLLVVSDVVLEGKVDESVAHGGFCFKSAQVSCWSWAQLERSSRLNWQKEFFYLTGVTFVLSNHCRLVDVQLDRRRRAVSFAVIGWG